MRGWLAYLAQARTVAQQIEAYRRLSLHLLRYRRITVLDFDERAAAFDAAAERAVRAGDTRALLDLDPGLARDLMATGRPAWQVLAGALEGCTSLSVQVPYAGDPFGVAYLVATLRPSLSRGSGARG